jgi:hypothetical protein
VAEDVAAPDVKRISGRYCFSEGSFRIARKRSGRTPDTLIGSLRRIRFPPTVGSAAPIFAATFFTVARGRRMRAGTRDNAARPFTCSMSSAGVRPAMFVAPKEKP